MINFKETIIISVILFNINFAQTANKINSIKIDTTKNKNKKEIIEKQSLRLYEFKILYNNLFNKLPFYIPENNTIYMGLYTPTNYGFQTNNYRTNDGLKLFNENLHKMLVNEYGKRGRYDLGEFGRYLGVAKKVATIILWLLSF